MVEREVRRLEQRRHHLPDDEDVSGVYALVVKRRTIGDQSPSRPSREDYPDRRPTSLRTGLKEPVRAPSCRRGGEGLAAGRVEGGVDYGVQLRLEP